MAERFLYLPSAGFCLMVSSLIEACRAKQRLLLAGTGVLVALMLVGTNVQNRVWKNEVRLFTELVHAAPQTPSSYYNLGMALAAEGENAEAVSLFRRAIALDPDYQKAYWNLGNSYLSLARYREAAESFAALVRIDPDFIPAYTNLGTAYLESRDYTAAIATFRDGLRRDPGGLRLHVGLTLALIESGDLPAARRHQRSLMKAYPRIAAALDRLVTGAVKGP